MRRKGRRWGNQNEGSTEVTMRRGRTRSGGWKMEEVEEVVVEGE